MLFMVSWSMLDRGFSLSHWKINSMILYALGLDSSKAIGLEMNIFQEREKIPYKNQI